MESNKQNKLTEYKQTQNTENRLTAVRGGGLGRWVKKLTELTKTHRHRQQYGNYQMERGWRQVEEGKEGINGDGKKLEFGW